MGRQRRRVITIGTVVLLCAPVAFDRDGLPLSTYPMYARTRGAEVSFVTANGIDADGRRVSLGLGTIGESDDPLIVAGELRAAIRSGRAPDRCRDIASRVEDGAPEITAIEVVTERHDVIEHAAARASLVGRTVHATCEVGDV